jgi:hypothetical protein
VKKFFAYYIVSLVFSLLLGVIVAGVDYFFGEFITKTRSYPFKSTYECLDTLLSGCVSNPVEMFGYYPLSAFGMMILAYPIFRAVVGSFKIVFIKTVDNSVT